jgi:hypothetical protein
VLIRWRTVTALDRAAEMRALAEGMKDAEPQQMMNRLADHYHKLADRAASRARSVSSNLRRDFGSEAVGNAKK